MSGPRLGFFTRLLEDASAADRYRFALEQIDQAEQSGFASAWIAQHHFGEDEGGLPSPFVLLAAAAERTSRIALATGVVTLPIDDPLRVAEDAAVLDQLSGASGASAGRGCVRESSKPSPRSPARRPPSAENVACQMRWSRSPAAG